MLDRLAADILERGKRIADGAVAREEACLGAIDRRRLDADADAARFLRKAVELVGIADIERHRRRQELDRVIGLEIGGLIGDQRIGRGVGLVEAVAGEFRHQLEDVLGARPLDAVGDGALDEARRAAAPSPS